MKVAFFDFDGTITKHDTFIKFAKFSLGKKSFYSAIVKNSLHLAMWKLGLLSNSKAKQRLFSTLYKGKEYEWFKASGIKFKEIIAVSYTHLKNIIALQKHRTRPEHFQRYRTRR